MENFAFLAAVWKNKKAYRLIEEDLLIENTFVQQTSKNENLWKAELGETENYIIFLRCGTDKNFEFSKDNSYVNFEHAYVLINMIPKSHLKVTHYSRRKLQMLFPSGYLSYFKLLMCPGCGKAWTRWKKLVEHCDRDILPLAPLSRLILFSDLDEEIQRNLRSHKFLFPSNILKRCFEKAGKSDYGSEFSINTIATSLIQSSDSGVSSIESDSITQTESEKSAEQEETEKKEVKISPQLKTDEKVRKTKTINRFGEGVPEGCVFDLSLSYTENLEGNSDQTLVKIPSKEEPDIGFYDYFSPAKMALKTMSSSDSERKIHKRKKQKIKKTTTSGKARETPACIRKILNATKFFTNVSLTLVPDGLRRSKSVDSILKIYPKNQDKISLNCNISLPNINELEFHRRSNRLSYNTDHFDDSRSRCLSTKEHSIDSLLFWLPDASNPDGRIYCTRPTCCKMSLQQAKNFFFKQKFLRERDTKHSNLHLLSTTRKGKGNPLKMKENLDSVFLKRADMATDELQKMKKELPKRPRVCASESKKTNATSKQNRTRKFAKSTYASSASASVSSYKSFKTCVSLEPLIVAHELQRIQQQLFCEIEDPEIARYILHPDTVTEVNCPYLYGFLLFFERLQNLVTTEILSEKNIEDAAQVHHIFVQVAISCLKKTDEQSTYSIIAGLCNPSVMKRIKLWSHILQNTEHVKFLTELFSNCWKKNIYPCTRKIVPFFLDFITLIVQNILNEAKNFPLLEFNEWHISVTSNVQKRSKVFLKVFAELKSISTEYTEDVIRIIEECRKYFNLENLSMSDNDTRTYLLFGKYKNF